MDRNKIFEEAMRRRKEEKAQEQNRSRGGTFENVSYTALDTNHMSVVRLLGVPMSMRDLTPNGQFSSKKIDISWIVGDNGKKFRCIFPDKHEEPSWLLWRVLDLVLAGRWDSNANARVYDHKENHPTAFNLVFKNGVSPDNKFIYNIEKGWKPSSVVVANVIDRAQMEWHKQEKKTFVLSKKASTSSRSDKGTSVFFDTGIPVMLYQLIMDEIVEAKGDFEFYDIGIVKLKEDPWYRVYYLPTADPDFLKKYDLPEGILDSVSDPLTEEERMWKQWDLNRVFPVTSYQKIKSRLSAKLQLIDKEFGTRFLEELEELAIKEKAEKNKKAGHPVDSQGEPTFDPEEIEAEIENDSEEKTPSRPTSRQPAVEEESFNLASLKEKYHLESLSQEMLDMIVGEENNELIYDLPPNEQLYKCNDCGFKSPGKFSHCPKCGTTFA